jgi:DNA-binding transcriptional MerR regulator
MATQEDRRYGIAKVSEMAQVEPHVLRQWEKRFSDFLKPSRDRAGRRYYLAADIAIIRRIKQLIRHEKLTTEGVKRRLTAELYGEGQPKTRQEMVDLLDAIEHEVRKALDLLTPE